MSRRGESRLADAIPDLVSSFLDKLAVVAGLALVATFAYLAYALFSASVQGFADVPTHEERARILGNLGAASNVFLLAGLTVIIYTMLRVWEHAQLALGLAVGGAALFFGAPLLVVQALGVNMPGNAAALVIQGAFTSMGQILLVAAVVRGVPALFEQLRSGFQGVGEESATRRAAKRQMPGLVHPLSPCWNLPYCRPYIRDKCIRYRERKTCWRKQAGCMCDDDIMAAALMGAEGSSAAGREKLMLEFLPGAGGRKPAGTKRRITCKNCFIYLEHQRLKHKFVAPMAIPLVLGLFYLCYNSIDATYRSMGMWVTNAAQRVALDKFDPTILERTFTSPIVEWLILACIGIYTLTYLLRLLEYLFFKLKI